MKIPTLYPCVGLCVLLLAGCGGPQREEPVPPAPTSVDASPQPDAPPTASETVTPTVRVVVLGNSLSAGYGLDPEQAFPALIQQKVDSLGWDIVIVNAGLSGETTAGGLSRIDWLLRQRIDVLILELGGNDGLRGIATEVTKQNLQAIIDKTQARYPKVRVVLAGMQVPTNLGPVYTARFRNLYPELALENTTDLIPFLLEGVGGVRELNLPDGIHPTAEGHQIVAETVWKTLRPVLESLREAA